MESIRHCPMIASVNRTTLVIFFLALAGAAAARDARDSADAPTLANLPRHLLGDFELVCSGAIAPSKATVTDLAALATAVGGLIPADERIYEAIHSAGVRSPALHRFSGTVTGFGEGAIELGACALAAGAGALLGDARASETGLLGVEAIISSGIAVRCVKLLAGRERPSAASKDGGRWESVEDLSFRHPPSASSIDAFPSGHATTAFAVATVVAGQYAEYWFVPPAAYGLAALIGLSRIEQRTHWASDIVAGAVIGHLFGKLAINRAHPSEPGATNVSIMPSASSRGSGVSLVMTF
jgi:membrane-associated phospholipid phosphatase